MNKQTMILVFLIFLLSTGGYMAMPLFPLLTEIYDITLVQASSLTAVYIFAQKASPVILGSLGDLYGYKRISIIGESLRGIGFIGIGMHEDYLILLMFTALSGLGGGIAGPSLQALVMKSGKVSDRTRLSSLRASATNAGLLVGPILAGIVISTGNLQLVFIIAGIQYLLGSILLLTLIRISKLNVVSKKISMKNHIEIIQHKEFIHLLFFTFIFYILFAQLFVTMPEYAKTFTTQIQLLFLVNGLVGLLIQYPVGVLITRNKKHKTFIIIGIILITLSFVVFGISNNLTTLLLGIILFTIGEVMILPIMETIIADYSNSSGNMALYFGISKLSDGIGRPIGSLFGGWLISNLPPLITWFTLSLIGVILLLYFLRSANSMLKL